ncbi:MAG TPA: aldehyde dehydrogenase family protein, partial [Labilithrix sp.]|nr:aldehyde dehydrogenase family protein [Labilithrix sp.]
SLRLSADFRRIASSLLLQILQYLSSSLLALLGTRRKYSVRKPFVALAIPWRSWRRGGSHSWMFEDRACSSIGKGRYIRLAMPFTPPPAGMPPTSIADVDAAIDALYEKRTAWRAVSIEQRAALLDRCVTATAEVAERWVDIGARIKGLDPNDVLAGEEWLAGVVPTIRNARLLAQALRSGGHPRPVATRTTPDGRTVARVFPSTLMERVMMAGVRADVWIERGKPPSQGAVYRNDTERSEPRVCLVLGGGNVSSIPAMDALYKLFVEDDVVLLKMNPVNEALGPILAAALAPLVDGGWLAIVYGGSDVGAHAAAHPKVGTLHVTGSDRTYDAIVWGGSSAAERALRKERRERANEKPFSAELGCVTPVLVLPGPWSHADIRFQARNVAAMVTQNASFNCNAGKVVVVAKQWLQKDAFLAALHDELRKTPPRKAYYPGAKERYAAFLERYPRAVVYGATPADAPDEVVPWTVIPDVGKGESYALRNEAFCGIVAEVQLDAPAATGASVPRFLESAVQLANDACWGTLSCCLLVHPATEEAYPSELARAQDDLRYGAIGINAWPGLIYALVSPTWGAYPGHTAEDIQSGTGVVHNAWLFDHPEKSIVRAPFRIAPTPAWFGDHRNLLELGRRVVAFEAAPSWGRLARVALAALKG